MNVTGYVQLTGILLIMPVIFEFIQKDTELDLTFDHILDFISDVMVLPKLPKVAIGFSELCFGWVKLASRVACLWSHDLNIFRKLIR